MINEKLYLLIKAKEEADVQIKESLTKIDIIKQKINENIDIPEIINTLVINLKREIESLKYFTEESNKILENIIFYCSTKRKENYVQISKCSDRINSLKFNNLNLEMIPKSKKVKITRKSQVSEQYNNPNNIQKEHSGIYDKAYSEMMNRIGKKQEDYYFQEKSEDIYFNAISNSSDRNVSNQISNSKPINSQEKDINGRHKMFFKILNSIKKLFTTHYKITKVKTIEEKERDFENLKNSLKNEGNKSFVPKVVPVVPIISNNKTTQKHIDKYKII